ncbi:MAG: hypothetical protein IK103_03495 [Bacteroidales bacterium]|nr:hypothetical protein [Bacteroidales bacterium]
MDNEKFEKKVIHLIFKGKTRAADKHYYFGSVACIYEHFSAEDIGITHGSLRNYRITEVKPYENNQVIIRQGKLHTKLLSKPREKKPKKE